MKKILFAALLCLSFFNSASAQCVFYTDETLGAWGIGYNDNGATISISTLSDKAAADCRRRGGVDCKLSAVLEKAGWVGVIKGKTNDGRTLIQSSDAMRTKDLAIYEVQVAYQGAGGINMQNYTPSVFYVYMPR